MSKCPKIKNPCKICRNSVSPKTGLQCKGACRTWIHYKCLNYTPGKIADVKNGIIKVLCPCPDCKPNIEVRTDEPYYCQTGKCPVNDFCTDKECPENQRRCPKLGRTIKCGTDECIKYSLRSTQTDTSCTLHRSDTNSKAPPKPCSPKPCSPKPHSPKPDCLAPSPQPQDMCMGPKFCVVIDDPPCPDPIIICAKPSNRQQNSSPKRSPKRSPSKTPPKSRNLSPASSCPAMANSKSSRGKSPVVSFDKMECCKTQSSRALDTRVIEEMSKTIAQLASQVNRLLKGKNTCNVEKMKPPCESHDPPANPCHCSLNHR